MKTPKLKFKVGDKVTHPRDLDGNTEGEVVEISRRFSNGKGSLVTDERDIPNIREELNARVEDIDGHPHFVHDGDEKCDLKPTKAPHDGWLIVTNSSKGKLEFRTCWNQRQLKKVEDSPETKIREIVNEMSEISLSDNPDRKRFLDLDEQASELLEDQADPEVWKQKIVNAHEFMNSALA